MPDVHRKLQQKFGDAVDKPTAARVYDYALGGKNNYAIDRHFFAKQEKILLDLGDLMRWNRAWVGRAVRFGVEQGVRQFVDIGSGLPTRGNVHEIADEIAPGEASVVYLDNDPIVRAHAEILLAGDADPERHKAVYADFFEFDTTWAEVLATGVIDPAKPIFLSVAAVLHFMPPDQRPDIPMDFYRDRLPLGSLLAFSHAFDSEEPAAQQVADNYTKSANVPFHLRTEAEIVRFFGDFELVPPGLTWSTAWRPDKDTVRPEPESRTRTLAGVGRKSR